jgi:Cu(I)/Ag(I) efflux system membrane fusion protein
VHANVAAGGQVMDSALDGKWICPMHPEVIKDDAGKCDICRMPLVTTESLGYVAVRETESVKPLVIPSSAPLVTGKRAVVYVQLPDKKRPTFEGREIVLGPRAGDYYIVRHGLDEGELVVTQGNFKIDSALQISAKPSMMTPEGGGGGGHDHGGAKKTASASAAEDSAPRAATPDVFLRQMQPLAAAHGHVVKSVRSGDLDQAKTAFTVFGKALDSLDAGSLSGHPAMVWKELSMLLKNDAVIAADAKALQDLHRTFQAFERHWDRLNARFSMSHAAHASPATPKKVNVPGAFREQLGAVIAPYLSLQAALAQDDDSKAEAAAAQLRKALEHVDMKHLEGEAHMLWMEHLKSLRPAAEQASKAEDIKTRREAFALLSEALARTVPAFGLDEGPLFQLRCPMAFNNRGATWLQRDKVVQNPYFGQQMLQCGEVVKAVSASKKPHAGGHDHE